MNSSNFNENTTQQYIDQWSKEPFDQETIEEVQKFIKGPKEEVEDAFKGLITFGTGGMREKMGVGPNRINKYTIGLVTQAIANYIKKQEKSMWKKAIVICHDCRIHGREFAMQTARVFAGNDIPVYITKDLRPTPFCSFAIRDLKACAGVNITASHNPKEYNGYKVYFGDGGQVVAPHDKAIIEEVHKVDIDSIKLSEEDSPLIKIIDEECEQRYLEAVYDESLFKRENEEHGKELSICYSPLHGAGITMIPNALALWGFEQVTLVETQAKPDGEFPTTKTPNPETESGRACGIETLKESKGDLLLISDPDSDRLSVSIQVNGNIHTFSGNEVGIIFLHFLIKHRKLEKNFASVTTIVSTPLCKKITEDKGGKCFEVLTGFKYIAELIKQWENTGPEFVLGFEESLGYLSSVNIRDKDAVLASCQISEIALHLKLQNKSLLDYLYEIYEEHGIYREAGAAIRFEDKSILQSIITPILENPPKELFGKKVVQIDDYSKSSSTTVETNTTSLISLPKSNVLTLFLNDGSRFIIRPSGTEPLIKIYGSMHIDADPSKTIKEQIQNLDQELQKRLDSIKNELFAK